MGGGFIQLAAYGAQDLYLTGNPQISYFIMVYKRYTNFAIENVRQYFTGQADFGKRVYCQVDRVGDLMSQTFLVVDLPSLEHYYTDDAKYYWVNSVGHALIEEIEMEIGGKVIDRHYSVWMEIWVELTLPAGKYRAYGRMTGRTQNSSFFNYEGEYKLYVPLHFWFCRDIGLSLPLIALQNHEVRFNVKFRNVRELIVKKFNNEESSCSLVDLPKCTLNTNEISLKNAFLYIDYIFLEDKERRIFAQKNHQYLIDQVQLNQTVLYSGGEKGNPLSEDTGLLIECPETDTSPDCATRLVEHKIEIDFNHPVIEMVWVYQNQTNLKQDTEANFKGNEIFNFGIDKECNRTEIDQTKALYNIANHPLQHATLYIEGKERFEERDAMYFNTIQIYQRHKNNPIDYIYNYSFSLDPENARPSGACNFSRIDNSHFIMKINNKLINPRLSIYARNYNVLEIKAGMAGIRYSN